MNRFACSKWTTEHIELLRSLVESGASPARASVILRRPKLAVQNKARQLGWPFPDVRNVKATRLAREAAELERLNADSICTLRPTTHTRPVAQSRAETVSTNKDACSGRVPGG